MRLISYISGSFPATFAKVDNRYPTSLRSFTGYSRRVTASMSLGGPGGYGKQYETAIFSRN